MLSNRVMDCQLLLHNGILAALGNRLATVLLVQGQPACVHRGLGDAAGLRAGVKSRLKERPVHALPTHLGRHVIVPELPSTTPQPSRNKTERPVTIDCEPPRRGLVASDRRPEFPPHRGRCQEWPHALPEVAFAVLVLPNLHRINLLTNLRTSP